MAKKRGVILVFLVVILSIISFSAMAQWTIESQGYEEPAVVEKQEKKVQEPVMSEQTMQREEEARMLISEGEEILEEMQALGYSTAYIEDLLFEAKRVMAKEFKTIDDYEFIREIHAKINKRKEETLFLHDKIQLAKKYIAGLDRSAGNFSEIDARYESVVNRFNRGQFKELREDIDLIYTRAEEIMIEQSRMQAYLKASQRTLKNYVKNNWLELLIGFVLVLIVITYASDRIYRRKLQHELEDFKIEKKTIKRLMKKAQEDHYAKGKISKAKYTLKMKHLKNREVEISEREPVVQERVKAMKRNVFLRAIDKFRK